MQTWSSYAVMDSLIGVFIWMTFVVQASGQENVSYFAWEQPTNSRSYLSLLFGHPEDWIERSDAIDQKNYYFDWNLNHLRPGLMVSDFNLPGVIFAQDRNRGHIYEVTVSRTQTPKISSFFLLASEQVKGLTLDWVSQNIYFTDRQMIALWSYNNRRYQIVLENLDSPQGIDVDPQNGFLFWAESTVGRLRRSSLSGTNVINIVTGLTNPSIITADTANERLYWVSGQTTTLESSDYQGSNRVTILSEPSYKISSMDVIDSYILLLHQDSPDTFIHYDNGSLYGRIYFNLTGTYSQHGLTISSPETQPTISTSCSTDNGGCAHLCVHDPIERSCLCQFGFTKDREDDTKCILEYTFEDILLFADISANKIFQIDLNATEVREIAEASSPYGVSYNPLTKVVYYTSQDDDDSFLIKSFNLETLQEDTIRKLSSSSNTESVAIDPFRETLYYGDGGQNQISVIDLTTGNVRVFVELLARETALGLTVDTKNGHIYWARYSLLSSSIDRADLHTGRNVRRLASSNIEKPFGLSIDLPDEMIYWTDSERLTLERMKLDGSNREVIKRDIDCTDVAVDATNIYCTGKRAIVRLNKRSFVQDYFGPQFYARGSGLVSYIPAYQPVVDGGLSRGASYAAARLVILWTLVTVRSMTT